jgi:hypothetical protein
MNQLRGRSPASGREALSVWLKEIELRSNRVIRAVFVFIASLPSS